MMRKVARSLVMVFLCSVLVLTFSRTSDMQTHLGIFVLLALIAGLFCRSAKSAAIAGAIVGLLFAALLIVAVVAAAKVGFDQLVDPADFLGRLVGAVVGGALIALLGRLGGVLIALLGRLIWGGFAALFSPAPKPQA